SNLHLIENAITVLIDKKTTDKNPHTDCTGKLHFSTGSRNEQKCLSYSDATRDSTMISIRKEKGMKSLARIRRGVRCLVSLWISFSK
ncbi:hypothetical protein KAJ27_00785, partial [bacterium]|nr:hypothetical protein [bacterium]